jgi:hypothetical protein
MRHTSLGVSIKKVAEFYFNAIGRPELWGRYGYRWRTVQHLPRPLDFSLFHGWPLALTKMRPVLTSRLVTYLTPFITRSLAASQSSSARYSYRTDEQACHYTDWNEVDTRQGRGPPAYNATRMNAARKGWKIRPEEKIAEAAWEGKWIQGQLIMWLGSRRVLWT